MLTIGSLWLPILVSTVFVYIASFLIWMVLQLHRKDWAPLPDEEAFASAVNAQNPPPGEYTFPYCAKTSDWKSEAWQAKFKRGPVGFLTLRKPGEMGMGKSMGAWIVYLIVIEVLVAYLATWSLDRDAAFRQIFHVTALTAILAFAGALPPEAIWMGRTWRNTFKSILDGIIYGLITAAVFAWLWP